MAPCDEFPWMICTAEAQCTPASTHFLYFGATPSLCDTGFFLRNFLEIFSSVQLSHSVMSDSLPTPWTTAFQASLSTTNYRSLIRLMSIKSVMPSTISSFVVPFSSHLQSSPASRSFPTSQLFTPGGQSIGV